MIDKTIEALTKLGILEAEVESYFGDEQEAGGVFAAASEVEGLLGRGKHSLVNELRIAWAVHVEGGEVKKLGALVKKSVEVLGRAEYLLDEVEGFFSGDYQGAEQIASGVVELRASLAMSTEAVGINY